MQQHALTINDTTVFHHGDFSGDVTITTHKLGAPEVRVPFEIMLATVRQYVVERAESALESADYGEAAKLYRALEALEEDPK